MRARPEQLEAVMRRWRSDSYIVYPSHDILRYVANGPAMLVQITGTQERKSKSIIRQMRAMR